MATISRSVRPDSKSALKTSRPIRPNPFTATFTVINIIPLIGGWCVIAENYIDLFTISASGHKGKRGNLTGQNHKLLKYFGIFDVPASFGMAH
jgi:hypothetical protein